MQQSVCIGATPGEWQTMDKEGAATMDIAFQTKPHRILPKAGVILTDTEIARKLGISEESARALIKAASPSLVITERTQ
jgi:hypothetical protein